MAVAAEVRADKALHLVHAFTLLSHKGCMTPHLSFLSPCEHNSLKTLGWFRMLNRKAPGTNASVAVGKQPPKNTPEANRLSNAPSVMRVSMKSSWTGAISTQKSNSTGFAEVRHASSNLLWRRVEGSVCRRIREVRVSSGDAENVNRECPKVERSEIQAQPGPWRSQSGYGRA